MSTYEAIKQEGIEKGEQIGIQKGKNEEKVKVVVNSFKNGIDISLIANITNLSEDKVIMILKENGMM